MAKKYVVYINGKDLATFPVTQNENGVYYRNSSGTYYKPTLDKFDNATLPSGYKKYTAGSHAKYKTNSTRFPIDFSIVSGSVITANFDIKTISYSSSQAWLKCQIVGTPYMIAFVHCYKFPGMGKTIKAGSQICQIAPTAYNGGYAVHLHIDEWTGYQIRKLILEGDFMSNLEPGVKLEQLENMNVRNSKLEKIGTAKKGSVCEVKSYFKDFSGFKMYLVSFADLDCYIADTNFNKASTKPVTNLDSSKPSTEVDKLKAEIKRLELIVEAQGRQITMLESQKKELQDANNILNKYKDWYDDFSLLVNTKEP